MKVKLLRQNRIDGKAGDIVEVFPARARFLFDMHLAVPAEVRERAEAPVKTAEKAEKKTAEKAKTSAKGKK